MPFFEPAGARVGLELTLGMPKPLVVAVLDKAQERDGRTTASLVQTFGYRDETEKLEVLVPASFLTDFASIPDLARGLYSPFGRHGKAAVVHDWLYAIGEPGLRDTADRVFLHAMTELAVEETARQIMYAAVQVGGKKAWRRAARDWPNTFADPVTGATIDPLFPREQAFVGQPHGPRRL